MLSYPLLDWENSEQQHYDLLQPHFHITRDTTSSIVRYTELQSILELQRRKLQSLEKMLVEKNLELSRDEGIGILDYIPRYIRPEVVTFVSLGLLSLVLSTVNFIIGNLSLASSLLGPTIGCLVGVIPLVKLARKVIR